MSSSGKAKAHPPDRPIQLLEQVVAGDAEAWGRLVTDYCGFLYALAWRYARGDADVASELVLVTLEGLSRPGADGRSFYRLRRYLDSLAQFGGRSKFVTWLAMVARNLMRDWFREHQGRKILPKEIEGLDPIGQEVFKLLFWQGMTETEAYQTMKGARPGLDWQEFQVKVEVVAAHLSEQNLQSIYRDLLRRAPAVELRGPGTSLQPRSLDVADLRPRGRPDQLFELAEDRELARSVGRVLAATVDKLPVTTRTVLLMHMVQGLSGDEIGRAMGFRSRQRVYDELAKARRRIGRDLLSAGLDAEKVARAEGFLDDILKKPPPASRSQQRFRRE